MLAVIQIDKYIAREALLSPWGLRFNPLSYFIYNLNKDIAGFCFSGEGQTITSFKKLDVRTKRTHWKVGFSNKRGASYPTDGLLHFRSKSNIEVRLEPESPFLPSIHVASSVV